MQASCCVGATRTYYAPLAPCGRRELEVSCLFCLATFRVYISLSLISILTHVDLVTRRVFFMVSEVQILIFQLFMKDTVVGVKSTTYSGLITSGFFRTNNNNNKRIF